MEKLKELYALIGAQIEFMEKGQADGATDYRIYTTMAQYTDCDCLYDYAWDIALDYGLVDEEGEVRL